MIPALRWSKRLATAIAMSTPGECGGCGQTLPLNQYRVCWECDATNTRVLAFLHVTPSPNKPMPSIPVLMMPVEQAHEHHWIPHTPHHDRCSLCGLLKLCAPYCLHGRPGGYLCPHCMQERGEVPNDVLMAKYEKLP